WVATLRGRGGSRRVTPPSPTPYGIYESTNGGATWTPRVTTTDPNKGATSLAIDPLYNGTSNRTMYATWWTQGISKTVDGGATWTTIMNGLPTDADYEAGTTRFSLGISHPASAPQATLYTGFGYTDVNGGDHHAEIWKSTDAGANWTQTNTAVVDDYCHG